MNNLQRNLFRVFFYDLIIQGCITKNTRYTSFFGLRIQIVFLIFKINLFMHRILRIHRLSSVINFTSSSCFKLFCGFLLLLSQLFFASSLTFLIKVLVRLGLGNPTIVSYILGCSEIICAVVLIPR